MYLCDKIYAKKGYKAIMLRNIFCIVKCGIIYNLSLDTLYALQIRNT